MSDRDEALIRETVKQYQRPWPVAWSFDQAADDLESILRLLDAERARADAAEAKVASAFKRGYDAGIETANSDWP